MKDEERKSLSISILTLLVYGFVIFVIAVLTNIFISVK